jgi:putative sterol carrier protein
MVMPTIEELIENLPSKINISKLKLYNTVIQLFIEGENGGNWYLQVDEGFPTLLPGCSNNPDLSLMCSYEDLISLSLGDLDPGKAFMTGKLTIRGNRSIALRLLEQYKTVNY